MSAVFCLTFRVHRGALCLYQRQNNLRKLRTITDRLQQASRLHSLLWPDERSMSRLGRRCSRKHSNKRDVRASYSPPTWYHATLHVCSVALKVAGPFESTVKELVWHIQSAEGCVSVACVRWANMACSSSSSRSPERRTEWDCSQGGAALCGSQLCSCWRECGNNPRLKVMIHQKPFYDQHHSASAEKRYEPYTWSICTFQNTVVTSFLFAFP